MATDINPVMERAARALAARHYAYRFGRPAEHKLVTDNVEAGWRDFLPEVTDVIAALREPDAATLAHAVKTVKDRPEAVEHFHALLGAISA